MKTIFNLLLSICMLSTLSSQMVIEGDPNFEFCMNTSQTTESEWHCVDAYANSVLTIGKDKEKVIWYINGDTHIFDVQKYGRDNNNDDRETFIFTCTLEGDPADYVLQLQKSNYKVGIMKDGELKVVSKHQVKKWTILK